MEFKWRVDNEEGVVLVKIDGDLCREGSEKDGEDSGLSGDEG